MALTEIKVPDVGNVADIDVVEVLIQPGERIAVEQTVAVLETDKATMDLPSSAAGTVKEVHIKAGDKVAEGSLIATLESSGGTKPAAEPAAAAAEAEAAPVESEESAPAKASESAAEPTVREPEESLAAPVPQPAPGSSRKAHATPSVRLFARELGVDLSRIESGSGRKGRILKEDVKRYVKQVMSEGAVAAGSGIPPIPAVDFSRFGEVEEQPLNKIRRLTGKNLSRVWLNLPMVTYHDEADITELEAFRTSHNAELADNGVKLTGLVFITKALVAAMQQFPSFNSSLSADGERLIVKRYFHVGIAVDTPNGLVVPVLRDVNRKGIYQLSSELSEKSQLARKGRLMPADMQGGCMTISGLGGIGGTGFTPIVNAPEVAILGVTRARMQPVWDGEAFQPRLMLPLDLTYDHRVIDGAEGARFMEAIKNYLGDIRRLLL
jgi:pyruvate dehydrogenase E2 component (dihydrolipoyllysine-residue acetyltransferase)